MIERIVLVVSMAAFTLFAIVYAARVWMGAGSVEMGFHGWFAMALGVVLTLGLGILLMGLVFYSARKGYDERHHEQQHGDAPLSRDEE
jgi:predicted membrane-bound mannosyltransferase